MVAAQYQRFRAAASVLLAVLLFGQRPVADSRPSGLEPASPEARFVDRAARSYELAKKVFLAAPRDGPAAWHFARACFDRAEYATNNAQRAAIAREGIAAARQLVQREPSSAAAHYYLGLNLGQLARTESFGALRLVEEMEREFARARDLDAQFDYAGPDRSLGLLYLDAPGWPVSVGSRRKARMHLEQAVARAPDYPENRLSLLEAYLRWNDRTGALRQWRAHQKSLPAAREQFQGEQWEPAWADWDKRWRAIRARIEYEEGQ